MFSSKPNKPQLPEKIIELDELLLKTQGILAYELLQLKRSEVKNCEAKLRVRNQNKRREPSLYAFKLRFAQP